MTTQPEIVMEQRVSRLEGAYEQVNERLGDLRIDIREGQAVLRAEMSKQFHTLLVLIGTLWATTLGGIIAILVRG